MPTDTGRTDTGEAGPRWMLAVEPGRGQNVAETRRWAMSTEFVLWSMLGAIGVVGGGLLLAALWSLVRRPREP
ncbi:hypothetical protein DCE94_10360 [Agromyces badenianii]|nr:hypothetical protein DCE94_10360 [Agromyces badenianii]